MITSTAGTTRNLFTAADPCDRCGARARVLAILHAGGILLFCGHHARAHGHVLQRIALCVEDPDPIRPVFDAEDFGPALT